MTYKEIAQKIINDPAYAKEIADLLAKARKKDQEAIRELEERFKLSPMELADLGKTDDFHCDETIPTQLFLIDFARFLR